MSCTANERGISHRLQLYFLLLDGAEVVKGVGRYGVTTIDALAVQGMLDLVFERYFIDPSDPDGHPTGESGKLLAIGGFIDLFRFQTGTRQFVGSTQGPSVLPQADPGKIKGQPIQHAQTIVDLILGTDTHLFKEESDEGEKIDGKPIHERLETAYPAPRVAVPFFPSIVDDAHPVDHLSAVNQGGYRFHITVTRDVYPQGEAWQEKQQSTCKEDHQSGQAT